MYSEPEMCIRNQQVLCSIHENKASFAAKTYDCCTLCLDFYVINKYYEDDL